MRSATSSAGLRSRETFGAELEVDRGVARRQRLLGAPALLDEDAQDPAAALGLELDVDHLGAVRAHDRLDDAHERGAIDSVGGGRGVSWTWVVAAEAKRAKKNAGPGWGPALLKTHQQGAVN